MKLEDREDVQKFIKNKIRIFLMTFTEEQNILFTKLYGDVRKIPKEKLSDAIDICERTDKKNKQGRVA